MRTEVRNFILSLFEPVFFLYNVSVCFFCNNSGENKKSYNVGNSHKTVEDVRNVPNCGNREVRADEDCHDVEDSVYESYVFAALGKVIKAFFTVEVPTENGRECEEYKAYQKVLVWIEDTYGPMMS